MSKILLAGIFGLMLGLGTAYIRENRDDVVRRPEELELEVRAANLALIPHIGVETTPIEPTSRFWEKKKSKLPMVRTVAEELVTLHDNRSPAAEAYRTLRTSLLFSSTMKGLKHIVITSAGPQEGKSMTSANLAIVFAQQGRRVLLVDCDLRRPRAHLIFETLQEPGLTNLIIGQADASDAIRETAVPGLFILPAGRCPPNPGELLGNESTGQLFHQIGTKFDIVIYDTAPVLVASDAAIVGRHADGIVLVVRADKTEWGAIRESMRQLNAVGSRLLGTVFNDPQSRSTRQAGYYYNNYCQYEKSGT